VKVGWTAESDIVGNVETTGYRVYVDDLSGNGMKLWFDSSKHAITTMTYITGLNVGQTYTVTVRAVNSIGESLDSNTLTINSGTVPSKI
jgi:hypothetical protein